MTAPPPQLLDGGLALGLLRASDALNNTLLERLAADGWPPISRTQALVFAHLDANGSTASDLARSVGITRQSMQKVIETLSDAGILTTAAHPRDARSQLIMLTRKGRRLMDQATRHLSDLEADLLAQLGHATLTTLRSSLALDWTTFFAQQTA
jgi:DNA-binding MarR family transcriptional regulator